MYDGESVARYDCEATEEDWLEISYTKRHYIDDEDDFAAPAAVLPHRIRNKKKSGRRSAGKGEVRKWVYRAAALAVMAGLLIAMRFVDSGFVGDVFKTAKETYTTSLISAFTAKTDSDTINIPINYNVESVADGNVVLGGGMLSLSLTDGKVEDVTENSVTVRVSDDLCVVYGNLSAVLVANEQNLAYMDVIGKYEGSTTVNLLYKGEKITDITAVDYTLTWQV